MMDEETKVYLAGLKERQQIALGKAIAAYRQLSIDWPGIMAYLFCLPRVQGFFNNKPIGFLQDYCVEGTIVFECDESRVREWAARHGFTVLSASGYGYRVSATTSRKCLQTGGDGAIGMVAEFKS